MTTDWLSWTEHHDLSGRRGNGPFERGAFLGVILHVNVDETGTPVEFFASDDPKINPDLVTPTFQVYKDGRTVQFLPLNWQPWCQIDGNFRYGAIETAGMPGEPLTAAQVEACGRIVAAYRQELGMHLAITDTPGQPGIGTHQMGGGAWGGHSCPGSVRAAQRGAILAHADTVNGEGDEPVDYDKLRQIVAEEVDKRLDQGVTVVKAVTNDDVHVSPESLLAGVPGFSTHAARVAEHGKHEAHA